MIWHNGKIIDESDKIDISNDHGIFETIRIDKGKAQSLDLHFARMRRSAEALGSKINYTDVSLATAIKDTIKACGLTSCAVRLTVADGIMIECYPPRYTAEDYKKGYHVGIIEEKRKENHKTYIHKTLANRTANILFKEKMQKQGLQEGLWLNLRDEVCEGIFSNIFIVDRNGIVATPLILCGLLPGITRGRIILSGFELGLQVEERILQIDDILSAREVFLTSALALAMPVVKCAGHIINNGKPGEITLKIKEALDKNFFNSF